VEPNAELVAIDPHPTSSPCSTWWLANSAYPTSDSTENSEEPVNRFFAVFSGVTG
jgi:hypothetical protein